MSPFSPKDVLVPFCIQGRIKGLGNSKEGDRRKQQWSTELVNRTKNFVLVAEIKIHYFAPSKVS